MTPAQLNEFKQECLDKKVKELAQLDLDLMELKDKQDSIIRQICEKETFRIRLIQQIENERIAPF